MIKNKIVAFTLLTLCIQKPLFGDQLESLSGFQHSADSVTAQLINRQFIRRLYDPIRSIVTTEPNRCCFPCNKFEAWFEAGGTLARVDGREDAEGLHLRGTQITLGLQKTFLADWTVGVAGSYENDDLHLKYGVGHEKIVSWFAGLYGLYRPSFFYGLVDFTYGDCSNKFNRPIDLGSLFDRLFSKPHTSQFTFYGEAGVDLNFQNIMIQPFFGIEAGFFQRGRIKERGLNGLELDIQKIDRSLASTRLGLHLKTCGLWQNWVTLSVDAAWNRRLSSSSNQLNGSFIEYGSTFKVQGLEFNQDTIDYALTFSFPLSSIFTSYVKASGELWNRFNVFSINWGLECSW